MAGITGFLLPAASIGLGSLLIRPRRGFFASSAGPSSPALIPIPQATIEERSHDELEITEHPVEQGAAIADHAYKRPAEVVIRMAWSNSPTSSTSFISQAVGLGATIGGPAARALAALPGSVRAVQSLFSGNANNQMKDIYQKVLALQAARTLFDVYTGKRSYSNMLIKAITADTDKTKENSLWLVVVCRQVIIVATQTVVVSNAQASPEKTGAVQDVGTKSLVTAPADSTQGDLTLAGSSEDLNGSIDEVKSIIDSNPDALKSVSGPLSQLNAVLDSTQVSVDSVLSTLPPPFEIPSAPNNAETFTVDLGNSSGPSAAIKSAIDSARTTLTGAQAALNGAQAQLPLVQSQLPTSMDGLGAAMTTLQTKFAPLQTQFERVLGE